MAAEDIPDQPSAPIIQLSVDGGGDVPGTLI